MSTLEVETEIKQTVQATEAVAPEARPAADQG